MTALALKSQQRKYFHVSCCVTPAF